MRGRKSRVGDRRVSPNGYKYVRQEDGWVLVHRLVAEAQLGRALDPNERIRFRDGDRENVHIANIEVYVVGSRTRARRRAELESRKEQIQAELDEL